MDKVVNWYAFKTHCQSALNLFNEYAVRSGFETFVAIRDGKVLIPNLIFIYCTQQWAIGIRSNSMFQTYAYCIPGTYTPAVIRISDMDNFKLVVATGSRLEPVGLTDFCQGDMVRVVDGPFKGVEGYISRVRNAKRLIVVLENGGICACGSHDELMKSCDTYKDIYASQMGEDNNG